jgi:cyclic pyranopterin phosphate synthase
VGNYNQSVDNFGVPDGVPPDGNLVVGSGDTSRSGRCTLARGRVEMAPATASKIAANLIAKGDVLATARVGGIMAARQASLLFPNRNQPFVEKVQLHFTIGESHVDVEASVDAADRTGVGLEVLSTVTVAALTIYDMCKSADRTMVINEIALWDAFNADGTEWHRASVRPQNRETTAIKTPMATAAGRSLTHVDESGKLRMVDVSSKEATPRRAVARCVVRTSALDGLSRLDDPGIDPFHAARLAGIRAAKRTADLIPLCHPLSHDSIQVDVVNSVDGFEVTSEVAVVHRTGVEMDALTACAFAALSAVNALFHVAPDARIVDMVLLRKSGGKSGDWGRDVAG